jgi:hypothetical protein
VEGVSGQSLVYFGVSGGALLLAAQLLRQRYVMKDRPAVRSAGGYTMFALVMVLFAIGAFLAGLFAA